MHSLHPSVSSATRRMPGISPLVRSRYRLKIILKLRHRLALRHVVGNSSLSGGKASISFRRYSPISGALRFPSEIIEVVISGRELSGKRWDEFHPRCCFTVPSTFRCWNPTPWSPSFLLGFCDLWRLALWTIPLFLSSRCIFLCPGNEDEVPARYNYACSGFAPLAVFQMSTDSRFSDVHQGDLILSIRPEGRV